MHYNVQPSELLQEGRVVTFEFIALLGAIYVEFSENDFFFYSRLISPPKKSRLFFPCFPLTAKLMSRVFHFLVSP